MDATLQGIAVCARLRWHQVRTNAGSTIGGVHKAGTFVARHRSGNGIHTDRTRRNLGNFWRRSFFPPES